MMTPQAAQDKFQVRAYNFQKRICSLIDIKLVNEIQRLKEGYKAIIPFDATVRTVFGEKELSQFDFSDKRKMIIERIKKGYEEAGWYVTYGMTGKCDIHNPELGLVFSIRTKEKNDES